jgi:peptidoglycan-N-acetylglucosamine deacetylase
MAPGLTHHARHTARTAGPSRPARPARPALAVAALLLGILLALDGAQPAVAAGPAAPIQPSSAHVIAHGTRTRHVVALTFDDCRDREPLLALFRILRREGVPATFFPYGYAVGRSPDAWASIAAAGFPIGNHTLSHRDLLGLTEAGVRYQFRAFRGVMDQYGLPTIPYVRPPYGRYDAMTVAAATREGYDTLVMWDIDTRDWAGLSAEQITRRATRGTNGSIVLMHCGPPATHTALPAIIAAYRARGFGFVTIPELIEGSGPPDGRGRTPPRAMPAPPWRRPVEL